MALRFGEVTALRRMDVNLLHRALTVEQGTYSLNGNDEFGIEREQLWQTPKGNRKRVIPWIPERALRVLEEQLALPGGPEDLVFPAKGRSRNRKLTWEQVCDIRARAGTVPLRTLADEYGVTRMLISRITRNETWTEAPTPGGVITHSVWHEQVWTPAVKKAGLAPLRPHDLRHSAASWLTEQGMDISILQLVLGHESQATTQLYVHRSTDQVREGMQKAWGEYKPEDAPKLQVVPNR